MRSRPTDGHGDSCSNCSGVAIVATAAAGANQYTRYAHARYDAWAIDEGCSETGRRASRVWKHHRRSGTTHSWTTDTTTITNHDQRRAAAATWCGEPHVPERVAATCKELAEDGVTEFSEPLHPTREKKGKSEREM